MLKGKCVHILSIALLFTVIFTVFGGSSAMGQRIYATSSNPVSGTSVVSNPTNAISSNESNPPSSSSPATISVSGIGGTGSLTLLFSTPIPLNSTVYVKMGSISGGSTVCAALKAVTTVASGSAFRSFVAQDGFTYFAVSASEVFDRVRITSTSGLLVTATASIYSAFFSQNNSLDCGQAIFTSGSGTLGGSVANIGNAIDGNILTKSTLTPGLLASNAEQTFYFSGSSTTSDVLKLSLSAPASALSATLLNNISVTFYSGNTSVYSNGLGSLLSVNLLNSLGNGEVVTTSITPNVLFDRISINFTALLSVLSDLYVHEVERVPAGATFSSPSAQNVTICSGSAASLVASTPPANYELRWYSSAVGGSVLSTTNPFTPSPTVTTTYYVSVGKVGCSAESERVPAIVTVNPTPLAPTASAVSICSGNNGIFNVNNPDVGYTYKWYTVATGGSSLFTGVTYTTPSTLISNTTFYVEAINGTCTSATRRAVTITVNPKPVLPHVNISSN